MFTGSLCSEPVKSKISQLTIFSLQISVFVSNAPLLCVGNVHTCNDSIDSTISDYRFVFDNCNVIFPGPTLFLQHLEPLTFGNASD